MFSCTLGMVRSAPDGRSMVISPLALSLAAFGMRSATDCPPLGSALIPEHMAGNSSAVLTGRVTRYMFATPPNWGGSCAVLMTAPADTWQVTDGTRTLESRPALELEGCRLPVAKLLPRPCTISCAVFLNCNRRNSSSASLCFRCVCSSASFFCSVSIADSSSAVFSARIFSESASLSPRSSSLSSAAVRSSLVFISCAVRLSTLSCSIFLVLSSSARVACNALSDSCSCCSSLELLAFSATS
mmetsp:Transcript_31089/g.88184  ORF Transcript_31089/g.88184 Transcript_31089/m.88184 type:complete len:243 (-) Transcript_31089:364-1092(-)